MLSRDYRCSPCGLGCTQSQKGGGEWPTSTGHAEIQGPGMRNWQVAEDPRDSFLLLSPEVFNEDRRRRC